jgi:type I site-specific restriction endonuclease
MSTTLLILSCSNCVSNLPPSAPGSRPFPIPHDYSEAATRHYLIDVELKRAAWTLDKQRGQEYEVTGMPNNQGIGYADYVLWGDDGKPLAVVLAKKNLRGPGSRLTTG